MILIAIAAIAVILKLQMGHLKQKFFIIVLIVIFLFFGITFVKVVNANSINLSSASGVFSGVKLYFSWLGHSFDNLQVLTGNVVRMNWFSNSTG